MKRLLLICGLLWSALASAQFTPGQLLTAQELNSQFALYAPLAGATYTGSVTVPTLTVTGTFTLPASTVLPNGVTATEQGYLDNSSLVATNSFVKRSILAATGTIPIANVTGGTYNFQTTGSGTQIVVLASGGSITSVLTVAVPGSGYQVGDCLLMVGGNGDAILRVTSLSGSGVAGASVVYGGTGYTTGAQLAGMPLPPGSRDGVITGTLTSNLTIIIPAGTYLQGSRRIVFNNNTTGAFTTTVKLSNGSGGSTGTGVVLPQGTNNSSSAILYTDGQNDVWPATAPGGLLYTQGGAGSVARTVTSKLQDTVSAFDFMTAAQISNVQGGTATVDVTAALQACINYVGSLPRGGTCYEPPGEYLISSTLTVTNPYVRLQGAGMFASVIVTTTNIEDILVGTNPITGLLGDDILDLGFYHTNTVVKTQPDVVMLSVLQTTVRAWFQNGAYGLVLYGGQGIKLDRIYAPGNYNPGSSPELNSAQAISLYGASTLAGYTLGTGAVNLPTEIEFEDPYITGPSIQGWEYGVAIFAGEHITFTGTYYVGQSTLDNVHIEQDANNQLILEPTLGPGGYIDGAGRAGIWVGGPNGNGSQYIGQLSVLGTVKGQSGTGLDGIYIDGTNRGGSFPQAVLNPVLAPTEVSGWSRYGMNLQGGANINIPHPNVFGNSFNTANVGEGINIGASVNGVRIVGGRSGGGTYGTGTGNQVSGITQNASATNVVIDGVDLQGNQSAFSSSVQTPVVSPLFNALTATGTASITNSTAVTGLTVTGTGSIGSFVTLAGNGATTPNKSIQAANGVLNIINNAQSTDILTLTDTGALTTVGSITPSQTAGIVGTTTNNNANAGSVGETITNSASGVSLTTGTPANVVSISLTAGDWDIWGNAEFDPAVSTVTSQIISAISTTSGTLPSSPNKCIQSTTQATGQSSTCAPVYTRLSIASTTTVYIVVDSSFTISTMTAAAVITARRRR
jgi:hypothetical protein